MIVRDLFDAEVAERLKLNFRARVSERYSQRSRIADYDAVVLPFKEHDKETLSPLLDADWLKLISRAMRLDTMLEIDGALHSHPPGSRSGWIHNDYNPGWFTRAGESGEVYINSERECDYKTGKVASSEVSPICRMRYLTLIYFLDNPAWSPGMGGETGIYLSQAQSVEDADILVPPLNNTLLAFECTPHSWHSFRQTSFPRNSITLWLHREFERAKEQWPHHEPVYWS